MTSEQAVQPIAIPAKFPLPKGYILVCGFCYKYKLYKKKMFNKIVYVCSNKKCGKIFTKTYVETFAGQMMVKE